MEKQNVVTVTALALGISIAVAAPAVAAENPRSAGTSAAGSPQSSESFRDSCFGYTSRFRDGTTVMRADFNQDDVVDECFGIAPSRSVVRTAPGAGGWLRMLPDGFKADTTYGYSVVGPPLVAVLVDGSLFCSTLVGGQWQPFSREC